MHTPSGPIDPHDPSDKSRTVALALAVVLGMVGGHRFYAGKIGTALLMLVTFGGLGFWWAFDVILVAAGGFRDDDGRLITDWDPSTAQLYERRGMVPEAVLDELEALRGEVGEPVCKLNRCWQQALLPITASCCGWLAFTGLTDCQKSKQFARVCRSRSWKMDI
jgi:hypothetical protein